jgi:hypothetical protein
MVRDGGWTRGSRGRGGAPGFSWRVAAVAVAAAIADFVIALILAR